MQIAQVTNNIVMINATNKQINQLEHHANNFTKIKRTKKDTKANHNKKTLTTSLYTPAITKNKSKQKQKQKHKQKRNKIIKNRQNCVHWQPKNYVNVYVTLIPQPKKTQQKKHSIR